MHITTETIVNAGACQNRSNTGKQNTTENISFKQVIYRRNEMLTMCPPPF
jgi:hypothetical protein